MHWLPNEHGFWLQSSTAAADNQMEPDDASAGSSMVVLVMRTLSAAVMDKAAPLGASLVRKAVSLMDIAMGPEASIAPPSPDATRNSWLDHIAMLCGQQLQLSSIISPHWLHVASKHPGNWSARLDKEGPALQDSQQHTDGCAYTSDTLGNKGPIVSKISIQARCHPTICSDVCADAECQAKPL